MATLAPWLSFILRFADLDIAKMPPQQKKMLIKELSRFFYGAREAGAPVTQAVPWAEQINERSHSPWAIWVSPNIAAHAQVLLNPPTKKELMSLRNDIRAILRASATRGIRQENGQEEVVYPNTLIHDKKKGLTTINKEEQFVMECAVSFTPVLGPVRSVLRLEGTFLNMVRVAVLFAVVRDGRNLLRHCAACDKIFVRVRRQEYCGITCRDRFNKRNERQQKQKVA